ncbi:hypothetical protein Fmac_030894 [Flemingia macrophylla]|uniref:Peptidase A1 domain-containing protein n=1 Tax=Flemingia macrophylla TaxID=520843 RepID=A0ABD1L0Z7_9FABA
MKMEPLLLLLLCSFSLTLAATDHAQNDSLSLPPQSFEFDITANKAKTSYLVNFNVTTAGRETVPVRANVDTGSDLTWLFGWACQDNKCYCDHAECIQEPTKQPEVGNCDACKNLPNPSCSNEVCRYWPLVYAGGFQTGGMLTRGIFWFNSKQFADVWFGLVDRSKGKFKKDSAGLVGLGRGKLSFISQLRIPFKFSYCLFDPSHPSSSTKLLMGEDVKINEQHRTTLDDRDCDPSHYCVRLKSISLNNKQVDVGEDNMIIDSGTTFTRLKKSIFEKFIQEVNNIMGRRSDPKKIGNYKYEHCYEFQENTQPLDSVSFVFENDLRLKLKKVNFFDEIYDDDAGRKKYLCLTVKKFQGAKEENVLGSRAQIDFEVAISDTPDNKYVSFTEKNCNGKQSNINNTNKEEQLAFQE